MGRAATAKLGGVLGVVLGTGALSGCVAWQRPVVAPANDGEAALLVASGLMPPPIDDVARHAWFAVRRKGSPQWSTFELWGSTGEHRGRDPLYDHGGGGVMVHAIYRGAEAERMIECLEHETPGWDDDHVYIPIPGPNSNTYVETMMRRCDILGTLPATAIGRDHRGWFGITDTSEGTGFQVDTPIFGIKVGLKEGIEVHLFGFTVGIDFWPPAIIVPFGPGRIGFDDR